MTTTTNFTYTSPTGIKISGDEYITRQRAGTLPINFYQFTKKMIAEGFNSLDCKEWNGEYLCSFGNEYISYNPYSFQWVYYNGSRGVGKTLQQAKNACKKKAEESYQTYLANQPPDLRDLMW